MGDVDDVEHAEGDRDADRDGGIEAAEQQPGDDGVDQQISHDGQISPRAGRCRRPALTFCLPFLHP